MRALPHSMIVHEIIIIGGFKFGDSHKIANSPYDIVGKFWGVQFSRFSQLIHDLQKLDPRNKHVCT